MHTAVPPTLTHSHVNSMLRRLSGRVVAAGAALLTALALTVISAPAAQAAVVLPINDATDLGNAIALVNTGESVEATMMADLSYEMTIALDVGQLRLNLGGHTLSVTGTLPGVPGDPGLVINELALLHVVGPGALDVTGADGRSGIDGDPGATGAAGGNGADGVLIGADGANGGTGDTGGSGGVGGAGGNGGDAVFNSGVIIATQGAFTGENSSSSLNLTGGSDGAGGLGGSAGQGGSSGAAGTGGFGFEDGEYSAALDGAWGNFGVPGYPGRGGSRGAAGVGGGSELGGLVTLNAADGVALDFSDSDSMFALCGVSFGEYTETLERAGIGFPERAGYTFLGWAADSKAVSPMPLDAPMCSDSSEPVSTYFALWKANESPTSPPVEKPKGLQLANTGSSMSPLLIGAGAVVVLGLGAWLMLKRRRSE